MRVGEKVMKGERRRTGKAEEQLDEQYVVRMSVAASAKSDNSVTHVTDLFFLNEANGKGERCVSVALTQSIEQLCLSLQFVIL